MFSFSAVLRISFNSFTWSCNALIASSLTRSDFKDGFKASSDLVYSLLEQLMVGSYSDNSNYSNYYDYGLTDILFGLADTRNIANYIS